MSFLRDNGWVTGIWVVVLGGYALAAISITPGYPLTALGDIAQSLIPLAANAGLLLNAGTRQWRKNAFWMLLALSCTLWMFGQFEWVYFELYLRKPVPDLYAGDIVFFLRGIPVLAALGLQPHRESAQQRVGLGTMDFVLLLMWWTFLYVFMVLPWMYALPSVQAYNSNYDLLSRMENLLISGGFGYFWLRTRGTWQKIYGHLFGASALYIASSTLVNVLIHSGRYQTGSLYDLPYLASFLWMGTAGVVAWENRNAPDMQEEAAKKEGRTDRDENVMASRMAIVAVLSMPLFAIWSFEFSADPPEVSRFRALATLLTFEPLAFLVFLRQYLGERERMRLLGEAQHSVEQLQRLQAQLVQSEKLASLGQLAAGAAHEINNPLTAILGFSDLLGEDPAVPEKQRGLAKKIQEQARRTKTLVGNLQSFARQVPGERTLLDINTVVANAVQLRSLDRHESTKIEIQAESVLPAVRGDANQLTHVFFHIVNNAIDAMAEKGGVLTIKTMRERGNVVAVFSDTGPGIKEPNRVFDPFYTTKPVGKGTGLGLSICYGTVQEHGGQITCYNRPEGGAVFRVELPAVVAAFPGRGQMTPPPIQTS
jgi:signal transduction histidine kinase